MEVLNYGSSQASCGRASLARARQITSAIRFAAVASEVSPYLGMGADSTILQAGNFRHARLRLFCWIFGANGSCFKSRFVCSNPGVCDVDLILFCQDAQI